MERSAIRSVAFGGFDKEDVARYIEQLSQETEKPVSYTHLTLPTKRIV